jgi:AbiU2
MTDDERFTRWGEQILTIHEEIMYALVSRRVHNEVAEILRANPRLSRDSNSFYMWMASTYEDSILMAVRRQVDVDVRSISVARLLKEIIGCPHVLSRERFVEQIVTHYSPKFEGAAHSEFDRLVAPGAKHIDSDTVRAELADLRERTKGIKEYTNKRVAHFDAKGPKDSPIVLEIHEVLDRLHALQAKYMELLRWERYTEPPFAEPQLQDEETWKSIFREPWIP